MREPTEKPPLTYATLPWYCKAFIKVSCAVGYLAGIPLSLFLFPRAIYLHFKQRRHAEQLRRASVAQAADNGALPARPSRWKGGDGA